MDSDKATLDGYQRALHFDDPTKHDALDLFTQYLAGQELPLSQETTHAIMRAAIFSASKMQVYPTVGNSQKTVSGGCITLTELLRGTPSFSMGYFIQNLKHFLGYVKLPLQVYAELKGLIAHFALVFTLFKKYEGVLDLLGLAGTSAGHVKSLGWLLYLIAKNELFGKRKEIVECACLLVPVVEFLVTNRPPSVSFQKLGDGSKTPKQILCEIFRLKSGEGLSPLIATFHDKVILRKLAPESGPSLLAESSLETNVKRLGEIYMRENGPEELDESAFISGGEAKFVLTPFAAQSIVNVRVTPIKLRGGERSAREEGLLQTPGKCNITLGTNLHEAALAGFNIPYRASTFSNLTPISEAFSMNNWLQERIEKSIVPKQELSPTLTTLLLPHKELSTKILALINDLSEKISSAIPVSETPSSPSPEPILKKAPDSQSFRALYFCVADSLLLTEERKNKAEKLDVVIRSEEFHKSVFAAAAEMILLVKNIEKVRFEDVLEMCALPAFDFWKLIPSLLRFDPTLPEPIVLHFQEIEKKILAFLGWQKDSPVCGVIAGLLKSKPSNGAGKENLSEVSKPPHAYEIFFKKVLELVARLIVEITAEMKASNETLKEQMWEAMKYCLSVETEMLVERHIIQLVICSIYAVCKLEEVRKKYTNDAYKFNSIIMSYMRTNGGAGPLMGNMFYQVKLGTEHVTAIEFYNRGFLPKMQDAIFKICTPGGNSKLPSIIKQLSPNSPLHETLPAKYSAMQMKVPVSSLVSPKSLLLTPKAGRLLTPKLTPRTKGLIACTESPMCQAGPRGRVVEKKKAADFRCLLKEKILEQPAAQSSSSSGSADIHSIGRKIVFDEEETKEQARPLRRPIAVPGLPKLGSASVFKGIPRGEGKVTADAGGPANSLL